MMNFDIDAIGYQIGTSDSEYQRLRNLWASVLLQGVLDAGKYIYHEKNKKEKSRLYKDYYDQKNAYKWIMSDDDSHIGHFKSICQLLGFNHVNFRSKFISTVGGIDGVPTLTKMYKKDRNYKLKNENE